MKINKQIIRGLGFDIMRFTPNSNALARRVQIIQIEIMLIMKNYDYTLIALESGFYGETSGQLLQVDGIFCRSSLLD